MPDTDTVDSGLTDKLLGDVQSNSDDAASLNQKPVQRIKKPGAKAPVNTKPTPTPTPDSDNAPLGDSDAAAPKGSSSIMGGNTAISTSSMKGSALANDPSSNLARKSEYRNVFHKRGAEGKHNWGGK